MWHAQLLPALPALLPVALLALSDVSFAADLRVTGTGQLLDDDSRLTFEPGDPVTFQFTYSTDAPLANVDRHSAIYLDERPEAVFVATITTPFGNFSFGCSNLQLLVTNDEANLDDSFSIFSDTELGSLCLVNDFSDALLTLNFFITDGSQRFLNSLVLPGRETVLGLFEASTLEGFLIQGCLLAPCRTTDFDFFELVASVNTLQVETVPEASSTGQALAALVCLGVFVFRRFRLSGGPIRGLPGRDRGH